MERKGFYITYHGVVSCGEIIQASCDMHGDLRFDHLRHTLSDYLAMDELDFDPELFAREISKHAILNAAAAKSNPCIKRLIVSEHPTVLAFANLYDAESSAAGSKYLIRDKSEKYGHSVCIFKAAILRLY